MARYDYDIAIIGGGAAGLTVASGSAQLGMRTLLIEREPELGGDCLHYGCVPSKTLIRTASIRHNMLHAPDYGLPEVALPPVRFTKVAARIRSVIDAVQHHDSPERFCTLGAEVRFGQAKFRDSHTAEINGSPVTSKYWVLATGSSPTVPPIPGLNTVPYLTNREIFSLQRLPESLIILGGGPIACEMAQAFQRLGTAVSVIQRSNRILRREDKDIADTAMNAMSRDGVVFHLGAGITEVRPTGVGVEVHFESQGQARVVGAEHIFVALGRRPNVEDTGLENAGVEYGPEGVTVNERLRTSRPHILAAGDVLGRHMFTHAAGYEGGIVISNAVFKLPRKVDYRLMPRCVYTDPEVACIGMNEQDAEASGIRCIVHRERFRDNDRAWAERSVHGMVKLVLDKKEKPLGVQIAGPHAGEILAEWAAVFGGNVKLSTLASAVHPYPTLSEINKRTASRVFADKLFSDKVRRTLQFLFHYKGRACGST